MNLRTKGFTLIEIMLVVIIIGVLAAMVIPNIAGKGNEAKLTAARTDIDSNLAAVLDLYQVDVGRYPTTEQGLGALMTQPSGLSNWKGPYLKRKKMPKDPWGKEYVYVSPGVHNKEDYDLSSLGPDQVESSDDITNW